VFVRFHRENMQLRFQDSDDVRYRVNLCQDSELEYVTGSHCKYKPSTSTHNVPRSVEDRKRKLLINSTIAYPDSQSPDQCQR
jgi:hypothetical protein